MCVVVDLILPNWSVQSQYCNIISVSLRTKLIVRMLCNFDNAKLLPWQWLRLDKERILS